MSEPTATVEQTALPLWDQVRGRKWGLEPITLGRHPTPMDGVTIELLDMWAERGIPGDYKTIDDALNVLMGMWAVHPGNRRAQEVPNGS